ncbi:hypothetical protein PoB_005227900 [Plakobranchus ocellatus]|uniref:Uncharacterized protein n=1 Tax=Plakobranchus ocellatus TaxID=259542 RepID=A0AAV4BZU2_9GAST|nr:hypothetical protein PoB_005227900 [Plakobranchus ocellatus]
MRPVSRNKKNRQKRVHPKSYVSSSGSEQESENSFQDFSKVKDGPQTDAKRHSSRLMSKRSKPAFKLPSRDDIWDKIPSVKSPEKLSHLTPRKNVSNFTKVYNSYNFDDYEDTSDDESDIESHSNTDSDEKPQTSKRVKNYHRRIRALSSSSDENCAGPAAKHQQSECGHNQNNSENKLNPATKCYEQLDSVNNTNLEVGVNNSNGSTKDSNLESLRKQEANTGETTNIAICEEVLLNNQTSVSSRKVDDSDNSEDSEGNFTPRKKRKVSLRNSIVDSDDESQDEGKNRDIDSSEHVQDINDNHLNRAENLKWKQKNRFSDFKEAIAKRRSRLSSLEKN